VPGASAARLIYTLGTDRRSEEYFVEILLAYDLGLVLDVRSRPWSRNFPHFSRESLEESLGRMQVGYRWLGAGLGGLRKGGFAAYAGTEEFAGAVDALEALAREAQAVILCSERFPWKCHRKWIARELTRRGWRVEHIIEKDKVWVPGGGASP
jgi:uncharacterized protein (DUF488 family)